MSILFLTADELGTWTGGSVVASQELLALREFSEQATRQRRDPTLSSVTVFSRANLGSSEPEPWKWDKTLVQKLGAIPGFEIAPSPYIGEPYRTSPYSTAPNHSVPDQTKSDGASSVGASHNYYRIQKRQEGFPVLAHFYSGSFPWSTASLKLNGCLVTQTIAAHDKDISRREHEKLGWPFQLPHLTEHKEWMRYIDGYRRCDTIICPGEKPKEIVRNYGPEFLQKRIEIIPHGCHLPEEIKPLPKSFICGYAGSLGADKGVRYLLEAWKRLDYKDGSMLVLAGRDSTTPLARHMINQYGGGSIRLAGWQEKIGDFYNSISLYVQPSASEGFGLEILEAASYGRPVICSRGAGAADLLTGEEVVDACDAEELATAINQAKNHWILQDIGQCNRKIAEDYSWDKIRNKYKQLWTEVLDGRT